MVRKKKKNDASILHFAAIGVAFLVLIALAAYTIKADPPVRYDKTTLCPLDGARKNSLSAVNVILIDRTDKITEIQATDIRKSLEEMATSSLPHEKFRFYEIVSAAASELRPLLDVCNPGKIDDQTVAGKLETTEISKRIFNERFIGTLKSVLERLLTMETQPDSPIMELIQAAVVQDIKHAPGGIPRRLIIVSDLMQHSTTYSQYKGLGEKAFFASQAYRRLATDLTGVDVRVLYIPRFSGGSTQPPGHREFWTRFFKELGSRSVSVLPVEGSGWNR